MLTDSYDNIYDFDHDAAGALKLDAPFAPSGERQATKMLELAGVGEDDLLYDLGCGDGQIIVLAARDFGARAVGVELDPQRLEEARQRARWNGVRHKLTLLEENLFTVDISKATVVTLYLLPEINLTLRPRLLRELAPGTRIVSHAFDMAEWKPDEVVDGRGAKFFLWIVPAAVAGTWQWKTPDGRICRVELEQEYQEVSGRAWMDEQPARLHSARLVGTRLELMIQAEDAAAPQSFVSRFIDGRLVPAAGQPMAVA